MEQDSERSKLYRKITMSSGLLLEIRIERKHTMINAIKIAKTRKNIRRLPVQKSVENVINLNKKYRFQLYTDICQKVKWKKKNYTL